MSEVELRFKHPTLMMIQITERLDKDRGDEFLIDRERERAALIEAPRMRGAIPNY